MLSSLTNLADRNFILGFLLPVVMAAFAFYGLFGDMPPLEQILAAGKTANDFAALTVVVLSAWTFAVLLMALNHWIYRALEGYWGPLKSCRLLRRQRRAFARAQWNRRRLSRLADTDPVAFRDFVDATRAFRQEFPHKLSLVLPTRFGNAIRAFEIYSLQAYGIDAIPGWLRLTGVVSDSYSRLIDNARAEVDFFVNLCVLALLVCILCASRVLCSVALILVQPWQDFAWLHLFGAIAFGYGAYFSYLLALSRVPAWGDLIRSAFDLYLPDLARQLGYELPATLTARMQFWSDFNDMFLHNDSVDPMKWKRRGKQQKAS